MFQSWRRLAPLLAVSLFLMTAASATAATRVTKMDAMKDPFYGVVTRLALLQVDDGGSQTLVLRHVYNSGFKVVAGSRAGGEAVIDLRKVSSVAGKFVDVMLSSIARPGSVLLLHENGSIVELRGIWGNGNLGVWGNGNIGIWGNGNLGIWGNGNLGIWGNGNLGIWGNGNLGLTGPDNIVMHGPFFATSACGAATSFGEGVRHFLDPLEGFFDPLEGFLDPLEGFLDPLEGHHDPLVGIGTEGGCVGFAGLDIPREWFDPSVPKSIDEWLEKGLVATGGPLVKVSATRVDDVVLMPMSKNWFPDINSWMPNPEQLVDPSGGAWIPDHDEWIPSPHEWIPDPNSWYELVALSDGQLHGIQPGRRASIETLGVPGFATWSVDASSLGALTGLASPRLPTSFVSPSVAIPIGDMFEWPLTLATGTGNVGISGIESGLNLKTGSFLKEVCTSCSIRSIELGSLWAITDDGQLLFAPDFDPISGNLGFAGVLSLGSALDVDLGPSTLNLKSLGNGFTATIEASGDEVTQIDPSTVRLKVVEDGRGALTNGKTTLADKDGDGNRELVIKYDRKQLIERLGPLAGNSVTFELTWEYAGKECTVSDDDLTEIPCTGSFAKEVKILQ